MNLSRIALVVACVAAVPLLSSCHRDQAAATVDAKTVQQAQDQLAQPAWLRTHLPAHTVAYLRIPSPWSIVGGVPDGRPLDVATASAQNLNAIAAIRTAIGKDPVLADSGFAPYLMSLLVDLRSPLEAAAVDPIGMMSPNSQVLVSMRVAQHSATEINARFAQFASPAMQLETPLDATGNGSLANGAPLHFDAKSQRLFALLSRQPASAAQLASLLAEMDKPRADDPTSKAIAAQESHIDQSGEGLFSWVSVHGLGGMAAGAPMLQKLGSLPGDLVSKADSISFGAGSVAGHGRLQLRLYSPQARLLGYLAPSQFDPAFKVAGTPRWVANLALPDRDQWQQFENNLSLDFGAERAASWRETMAKLKAKAGFDLDDLGAWVGPELVSFEDDAGSYTALRVRDRKALYAHLEQLSQRRHWRYQVRKLDGIDIHTLSTTTAPTQAIAGKSAALSQLMSRVGTHLYWIEDGDFLIFSRVPQALVDRVAAHPDTSMAGWLKSNGYPGEHSLAGVIAVTHNAQRDAYYSYLQVLQILDDISGANTDLMDMPAAHGLNLPDRGMAGANIGVSKDVLSLSINYEQQPLELIGASGGGSGTTAIAGVAILAAIAIPAYQNYIIRAQVSEGLILAEGAKTAMLKYRQQHGRWPASNDQAGLAAPEGIHGVYVGSVSVGADGRISVQFSGTSPHKANAALAGKTLSLQATAAQGQGWSWQCSSPDIQPKLLPTACRKP